MTHATANLLVVDDEPFNREVIEAQLEGCGYHLVMAASGGEAWALLRNDPDYFDAVLLDRMMPDMDGLELLKRIKASMGMQLLPVILQTVVDTPEDIADGLREGAYYYLTKPFPPEVLREVVATALRESNLHRRAVADLGNLRAAALLMDQASFTFKTREEAQQLLPLLTSACPNPQTAGMGLMELMLNAVEHGNLEITYDEKTRLITENRLEQEIARRLALPEYATRRANITMRRMPTCVQFTVADDGHGFNWQDYLELSIDRVMHNHGRGIAMARKIAFTRLDFRGKGNIVDASVSLKSLIPRASA